MIGSPIARAQFIARFDPASIGRPPSDAGDADSILLIPFGGRGAALGPVDGIMGPRGEHVQVARASTATVIVGGVELTAVAGQARVLEDGLLLEPAATQLFLDPANLLTANWTAGGTTIAGGATDPMGGATAFALTETTATAAHQVFQLLTVTAVQTAVSWYVKPFGGRTFVRIADNGATERAVFLLTGMGSVVSTTGTSVRAEIEYVGSGWYRCTMVFAQGTALLAMALQSDATTSSYAGSTSAGMFLWRPQAERNAYATTWTSTSRAAETAFITLPRGLGAEWSMEAVALPAGAGSWLRGVEDVILALGAYQGANSIELYANAGTAVASVYDTAVAERHAASAALASGSSYYGQRIITAVSGGNSRPNVAVNGLASVGGGTGAGSGQFALGAQAILYLGSNSTGALTGGYVLREVSLRALPIPRSAPLGASSYAWPLTRGYCSNVFAALGDSLTAGIYDASITTPYAQGAAAVRGSSWAAHNFGIGSNTSAQTLARYRRDIRGRGYATMVLWIGINDVNLSVPYSETISNVQMICNEAHADGSRVILINLMPGAYVVGSARDVSLTAINAAIVATGLPVVDAYALFAVFASGVWRINPTYDVASPGSLHLSQSGQTLLATAVAAAL